tara:strand:+ start:2913 stop:3620 length:708 start_codon:yes stop_codon:yes gene_type:complete
MSQQASQALLNNGLLIEKINLSITDGFLIIIFSLIAGFILRFIFQKYSTTFSSKSGFGNAILLITLSCATLIAVVKSSLALSLGLVGALSVVRFRTAVKEPYNLSFILLSICIGISLGASQYIFALMILIFGSLTVAFLYKQSGINNNKIDNRSIDLDTIIINFPSNNDLTKLYDILSQTTSYYAIKTYDQLSNSSFRITIRANINNYESFDVLRNRVNEEYDGSKITFFNSPNT